MIVRKYKITFFASDSNPISQLINKPVHDNDIVLVKTVHAVDRKSVEKIAMGFVYEWLFEKNNEISDKLKHENCQIAWDIQCVRQPRD